MIPPRDHIENSKHPETRGFVGRPIKSITNACGGPTHLTISYLQKEKKRAHGLCACANKIRSIYIYDNIVNHIKIKV